MNSYRNLTDLPLYIYIKCLIDHDLSDIGNSEELWLQIRQDVVELSSGLEGRKYLRLQIEVMILKGKLSLIENCARIMCALSEPNKDFAKIMNRLCRTNFKFEEKLFDEVQRCLNRSEGLRLRYELKLIELQNIENKLHKINKGEKITREYFYDYLISLSDFAGILLTDKISTYEFYERLKRAKNASSRTGRRKSN